MDNTQLTYRFPVNNADISAIFSGRSVSLEAQLISKSLEDNIRKYTPRDSEERFTNPEAIETWFDKGRYLHWLVSSDDELAGIIWYGEAALSNRDEGPNYTFAIRLYDGFAGKGLAGTFMKQSIAIFVKKIREDQLIFNGIWLKTDVTNAAAIAAYTKFGYKEITRDDKRVTMSMTAEDIYTLADSQILTLQ